MAGMSETANAEATTTTHLVAHVSTSVSMPEGEPGIVIVTQYREDARYTEEGEVVTEWIATDGDTDPATWAVYRAADSNVELDIDTVTERLAAMGYRPVQDFTPTATGWAVDVEEWRRMSAVVICGGAVAVCRRVLHCSTCNRRRRFVQSHAGLYYSDILTCLTCGDTWCDGERGERPFRRGWRSEAVTRARRQWAGAMTRDDFRAFVHDEITELGAAW